MTGKKPPNRPSSQVSPGHQVCLLGWLQGGKTPVSEGDPVTTPLSRGRVSTTVLGRGCRRPCRSVFRLALRSSELPPPRTALSVRHSQSWKAANTACTQHSQLGAGRRLCRPHGPLSLPLLKEARASEIPHPRSGPRSPPGLPQQGRGWGTAELADRLSEGATAPRASSHPGPRDQAWQVSLSPPGAKPALSKASWQGACRPSRPLPTVSGAPVCSG